MLSLGTDPLRCDSESLQVESFQNTIILGEYLKDTVDIFSLIGVLNEPTKTAGECVISERPVLMYTVLQTLKHI